MTGQTAAVPAGAEGPLNLNVKSDNSAALDAKHRHQMEGVRSIAVFEAFKGVVVLLAGFGFLSLVHTDLQAAAEELVRHSHLNPARHYPRVFIEAASRTSPARLRFLAGLAFAYSTVRLVEAWGLWNLKAWAEWFAIISGSIYLPIEIFELIKHATWLRAAVLFANLAVVLYLIYVRLSSRRMKEKLAADYRG